LPPIKRDKVIKIDRDSPLAHELERRLHNGHVLEDLVFPDFQDASEYEMMKEILETMERASFPKEYAFAYIKTHRILTEENQKYLTREEKGEWIDAVEQYRKLIKTGAIKPTDSLVPFIQASKEVPNPKVDKDTLEVLFDSRCFHPIVVEAARGQFLSYHFPDCIFNVYKKLLNEVQVKSGIYNEDGTKLVTTVFNSSNPKLQCSLARMTNDKSVQDGIMYLFMGSVLSIRNVFAHKDVYLTRVDDTLDYLSFASFLFKILELMEKREKITEHAKNQ
jgi:uncharacterized protein (TIGR02391 family)